MLFCSKYFLIFKKTVESGHFLVQTAILFGTSISIFAGTKQICPSLVPLWYLVEHIEFLHGRYFFCFFARKNAILRIRAKEQKYLDARGLIKKSQVLFAFLLKVLFLFFTIKKYFEQKSKKYLEAWTLYYAMILHSFGDHFMVFKKIIPSVFGGR